LHVLKILRKGYKSIFFSVIMNKYLREYKNNINKLVKKSFPSLKKEKIIVSEFPRIIFWASGFVLPIPKFNLIFIKTSIRKRNNLIKNAILAHEISHIEIIKKKNKNIFALLFWGLCVGISWIFGKNPARENERKADLLTIKKGYGKELLLIVLNRKRKMSSRRLALVYKRGYLSP